MATKRKARAPRKSRRRAAKTREKRREQTLLLSPAERQKVALQLLYGSEGVATRVRGRKSLFREYMYDEGGKLAALGLTDAEIADFWNVHLRTLRRWMTRHHDFCHIIKKAKTEADLAVESSLFKRAKGYDYTEQHFELRQPPPQAEGVAAPPAEMTLVKEVRKHVAADTTAGIFWLLNRQRERWKDRRQLDIAPDAKLPLEIIISNGNATRRILPGGASADQESAALPAPRKGTAKP